MLEVYVVGLVVVYIQALTEGLTARQSGPNSLNWFRDKVLAYVEGSACSGFNKVRKATKFVSYFVGIVLSLSLNLLTLYEFGLQYMLFCTC